MIELSFENEFNLMKTFECGQNFLFESFDNGQTYYGPFKDRIVKLVQITPHIIGIDSNVKKNLKNEMEIFLRCKDDYNEMLKVIAIDDLMNEVISYSKGLRLLKQEEFECSISYLLSQCSNIPRIKHHLRQLGEIYGQKVRYEKRVFFLFPTREDLLDVSEDTFRELGFGYRAKYIWNFINCHPGFLLEEFEDSEEFNKNLQCIDGIGKKVADCIQLFGYGDVTHFPVDVWIKRFMIQYYNEGKKASTKILSRLGRQLFKNWAGYAQEFIYYYARKNMKIEN
ncbi:DNA-3-methyladenine glycosylase 2 [Candidatus Lokiarchaeum ossiferum]|uniref:DNA-3-methyladenine glycosylase 2 n=1 Tax=Candidatus Lokiarchaeum ossiferum TaxID=2951803 RepID=UPI00352DCAFE